MRTCHPFGDYFCDPLLRGPTIGSMLMCANAGLIGVFILLRRRALLGEVLAHAAYPGVVGTVWIAAAGGGVSPPLLLLFSFLSATLGIGALFGLERIFQLSSDSALTLVLSLFFGSGMFIASLIQNSHALFFKQAQVYLFGQAATMTDQHIVLYAVLSLATAIAIFLLYKELQTIHFDPQFAAAIGIRRTPIELGFLLLTTLAIVIGIRSAGIVLMSGMLIAPAIAAKPWSDHLSWRLLLAAGIGLLSGLFGTYLSLELPVWLQMPVILPTGPMILLFASTLALLGALFSPRQGLLPRLLQGARFRQRCRGENCLKLLWKQDRPLKSSDVQALLHIGPLSAPLLLFSLRQRRLLQRTAAGRWRLTAAGRKAAERIVRLHRLWEVYLVNFLGQGAEKVHRTAEELEHMMTPSLEAQLLQLLQDYAYDPHQQPIPGSQR